MAFFARTAGVVCKAKIGLGVKLFEQSATILEQRLAQTQLDRFAIAHSMAAQIQAGEPQEGLGFLELLVG
jgi:hypothetical protein